MSLLSFYDTNLPCVCTSKLLFQFIFITFTQVSKAKKVIPVFLYIFQSVDVTSTLPFTCITFVNMKTPKILFYGKLFIPCQLLVLHQFEVLG